jgi:hypothetical protein
MKSGDRIGGIVGRQMTGDLRGFLRGARIAEGQGGRERPAVAVEHDLRPSDAGQAEAEHAIARVQAVERSADAARERPPPLLGIDAMCAVLIDRTCCRPGRCRGRDHGSIRRDRAYAQRARTKVGAQDDFTNHAAWPSRPDRCARL